LTRVESVGEIEVMRIGPGDHFGEIGMLTGAPVKSKISAVIPATVYELTKDDLSPTLQARPEISHGLCRLLAERQAAGQLVSSGELTEAVPANRLTSWFSERLHRLYDIASTK
jgi:CRP-like cAMP-binding protein